MSVLNFVLWLTTVGSLRTREQEAEAVQGADDEAPGDGDADQDAVAQTVEAADETADEVATDAVSEVSRAFEYIGTTVSKIPLISWVILFAGILGGLIAGRIVQGFLRATADRLEKSHWYMRAAAFRSGASPAALALFAAGLSLGMPWDHLEKNVVELAQKAISFLFIISIGWFLYNLVDLVEVALTRVVASKSKQVEKMVVPLVRKALRIFLVVVFGLFVAENVFGADITAWVAGFGLAGLAISLSAQDSIKNLFGSVTIILDKPFAVGDRIIFNGADGFVEAIGFRSTRIRTFAGHVVTVPNMKFIDGVVENVSRRPFIRRNMNITITYDTPQEKIEEAVQIVRDMLNDAEFTEPFRMEERPPRVFFNEFNADSLNILVSYWFFLDEPNGRDWWAYLDHAQRLNLRLFRAYDEAGIEFAFPTQTLYLAGDPAREIAVRVHRDDAPDSRT